MKKKRRHILALPVFSLMFSGCGFGNWRMGYGGHMMDYGYGGGIMWIIFLIVIGILVYFIVQSSKSKGPDGSSKETPMEILRKRYAKGEITKREFDRMKKDIEG